jgi:hypothetical protein
VERHNLIFRMGLRRFTRLTNGFSKKLESHCDALALYFFHYNWMRIHNTSRVTPAVAVNITTRLWSWDEVLTVVDAMNTPKVRGPYKKREN